MELSTDSQSASSSSVAEGEDVYVTMCGGRIMARQARWPCPTIPSGASSTPKKGTKRSSKSRQGGSSASSSTSTAADDDTNDNTVCGEVWDYWVKDASSISTRIWRQANAELIVLDLSVENEMDKVEHWTREIEAYNSEPKVLFLIGNKTDLPCLTPQELVRDYANSHSLKYFEISAMTGEGVDVMLMEIVRDVLILLKKREKPPGDEIRVRTPAKKPATSADKCNLM
ncbi:hypothetical protein Pelo_322 [Pelomyxa schiedti]|nr:hypothetical protein Pelo_322 [Pelomyxa schiedti]